MADYAFGEVTRLLYDAIWNEFCDWGVELAKVRLADASLPTEVREATWWTLVEALDTYLRLLHPVMPFVTEALWAAIPHRASDPDLLIVARWPAPERAGSRDRGPRSSALIGLVGDLRNARATREAARRGVARDAGLRARGPRRRRSRRSGRRSSGWPGRGPSTASSRPRRWTRPGRPATSRSSPAPARSRRRSAPPPLDDGRAAPSNAPDSSASWPRPRRWLAAARERLANEAFMAKAPPAVVEGARAREAELAEQVDRLRDGLAG